MTDLRFKQPLIGQSVRVRPLVESDRDALFAVSSDPLIWEQHPQKNRYQRPVFDQLFDTLLTFAGPMVILDSSSSAVIGTSNYYDYSPAERSVCIGYTFIARACWGHTYNREMKRLMLDHAFQFVDTVYFHVGETNFRSQAAIKKIGAVECGELIRSMPDGTPVRSLVYKILRP